jgi:hypothetical protein
MARRSQVIEENTLVKTALLDNIDEGFQVNHKNPSRRLPDNILLQESPSLKRHTDSSNPPLLTHNQNSTDSSPVEKSSVTSSEKDGKIKHTFGCIWHL